MDDDGLRTPTRSEIDTFKILANPEFASIRKNEPTSQSLGILGLKRLPEEDDASVSGGSAGSARSERLKVIGRGRGPGRTPDKTPDRTPKRTPDRTPDRTPQKSPRALRTPDTRDSETPRRTDLQDAPRGATSRLKRNENENREYREDREEREDQDSVHTEVPEKDYYAFGAGSDGGVKEGDGPAIAGRINAPKTISPEDMKRLKAEAAAEIDIEKEALLYEIELLEKQGLIKLQRRLTMDDSLDSIQYQYDRANMIISTQQTVEWSKNGIRMGSTMLETLARKFGITLIDGFSSNLCKDMNKFNQPLTKIVRKYWRKGSSSPEMELGMIVMSSLAMTVLANKGLGTKTEKSDAAGSGSAGAVPSSGAGSALRPPGSLGPIAPAPLAGTQGTAKLASNIPEWAKSAMSAPLPKVEHFAKADTFPELNHGPPLPVVPVLQTSVPMMPVQMPMQPVQQQPVQQLMQPALAQVQTNPTWQQHYSQRPSLASSPLQVTTPSVSVTEESTSKKLTLNSPRSSRRMKRDSTQDLNLDM